MSSFPFFFSFQNVIPHSIGLTLALMLGIKICIWQTISYEIDISHITLVEDFLKTLTLYIP